MAATLSNTTALVTGASSGIGAATAKALAAHGAAVGLLARRPDPLAAVQADIESSDVDDRIKRTQLGYLQEKFADLMSGVMESMQP